MNRCSCLINLSCCHINCFHLNVDVGSPDMDILFFLITPKPFSPKSAGFLKIFKDITLKSIDYFSTHSYIVDIS